jgi:hypothetical protein
LIDAETHPHPNPPLEGEGIFTVVQQKRSFPFRGKARMGVGLEAQQKRSFPFRGKARMGVVSF